MAGLSSLVQAAAAVCGTEMAAISVVEENSIVLLHGHGLTALTLPRAGSFCSHAVTKAELVEVRDASLDPEWADMELVVHEPHVRFYAAAQLVDPEGMQLGTLCVLDRAPSSLTDKQREQLRLLADSVTEILLSRRTQPERFANPSNQNSLRTLASGVGHEINNALSFVATNLDFAIEELRMIATQHPPLATTLEEIVASIAEAKDGAQRIRKIVRGLQSFANQEIPKRPTNVENALEAAAAMASKELRPRASLDLQIESVPAVLADDGGLTHVVVNLLVNAAQCFAEANPGKNKVRLRAVRSQESPTVAISVTDNGPGIAQDVLPRIFDPFFTTKPVGHGSGLGLSLCHTIVSSLGGQLVCETAVGHGTTFTITLPIAYVRHTSSELPRSGPTTVSRGRILLVDDEESLLRAMTRLLKPDHEIVAISDARTALAMLTTQESEHERFDLVFCDLMMPHVSGMELFAQVKKHNPKTAERFVFMTAGAISDDARRFLAASTNPCVEKPFGSNVLRALAQKLVRKFASIRPIEKAE